MIIEGENLLKFNTFYEENINKCFMKETFPLNTSALTEWVDIMILKSKEYNNPVIANFAFTFAKYTKHINFQEFYDQLFCIGMELKQKIEEHQKEGQVNVVLSIMGDIIKSNLWVSLILWKYLKPYVTQSYIW